jgi:hypothetical protein
MPTSNDVAENAAAIRQNILHLYWGVWSELGVSGWGRTHEDWAIDPEPLIAFTPEIATEDSRLRDEVTDWCIHNWRHVSQVRLRNILRDNELESSEEWGEFSATVNRAAGSKFPGATVARRYRTTGRSTLRPLTDPSAVYLRMRAVFGLGARTEVLRYLLFSDERATAAELAPKTNYAKRNVAEACEILAQAGVLSSTAVGNRLYFSIADPPALMDVIGEVPSQTPDWPVLLRVVSQIFDWTYETENRSSRVLTVETHRVAVSIEEDLVALGITPPQRSAGEEFVDVWARWARDMTKKLSGGRWPLRQERSRSAGTENVRRIRTRRAS